MTEGIDYRMLDIPAERGKLIEWLTGRLTEQIEGFGEYPARAAAAIVVAIFANDLRDAEAFRWLDDKIIGTMADPDGWDFDESPESGRMRYIDHLVTAHHGDCSECGRKIMANEQYELVGHTREGDPVLTCTGCI